MCNVVHWFILEEGYREYKISEREAVVNHYKYQVRSSTVVDFATSKGHVSLQPRVRKHGWKSGNGAWAGFSSRVRPRDCDGVKQPRSGRASFTSQTSTKLSVPCASHLSML
jgi:hypothetical protein